MRELHSIFTDLQQKLHTQVCNMLICVLFHDTIRTCSIYLRYAFSTCFAVTSQVMTCAVAHAIETGSSVITIARLSAARGCYRRQK